MDYVYHTDDFSLASTLECGQCFRWTREADGSYTGIAEKRTLRLRQEGAALRFYDTTEQEFEQIWKPYFDLDTDYGEIYAGLCRDATVRDAHAYTGEIHILRQDPWEALCSFIISQNNNIPRITGIISRLCRGFGEQLPDGGFAFPTPERLAGLEPEDLSVCRAGFRAKYILDAARKLADGSISAERVKTGELDAARDELRRIRGVGPKVAECVLLFGFHRLEAFPEDVWIKRALRYFYPDGAPEALHPYEGVAQQVIFHYIRCCQSAIPAEYRK